MTIKDELFQKYKRELLYLDGDYFMYRRLDDNEFFLGHKCTVKDTAVYELGLRHNGSMHADAPSPGPRAFDPPDIPCYRCQKTPANGLLMLLYFNTCLL